MNDSKNILSLIGIPSEKVANIDLVTQENGQSYARIELVDDRERCPHCNSDDVVIKGYYTVFINNSIVRSYHMTVEVRMRRYKCKKCGRTFKETFPFYLEHKRISRAAVIGIIEDLKKLQSFTAIAKQYDTSANTVIKLFDAIDEQQRGTLTECLCIDEFSFKNQSNRHLKYPAVLSDPKTGDILDVIESRKQEYLRDYFAKLSLQERSTVKYFISDMNETYRNMKKAFFKDSKHIIDHFHVSKLFTNAIQVVRTRIMKSQDDTDKEYRFLKKHWKMFLCNRKTLQSYKIINKNNGKVYDWELEVNATLRKYPELNEVYLAKEEFDKAFYKKKGWYDTEKIFDFFIQNFCKSSLMEIQKIGETFTNWKDELVNSYSTNPLGLNLSNAMAESNNSFIKKLVNVSYGYGNFRRLRNRILYINKNRKQN